MHPLIPFLARIALGLTWLVAGIAKMGDRGKRADRMVASVLPGGTSTSLLLRGLPWLEVTIGLCLLSGTFTRISAAVSTGLLLLFSVLITWLLAQGKRVDCRCFGKFSRGRLGWPVIVRDLFLAGLGLVCFAYPSGILALDVVRGSTEMYSRAFALTDVVPAALCVLLCPLIFMLITPA